MTKVIFFDAAGTLIQLPRGVAHHYREVALRHGREIPEASLRTAFAAAWSGMPARATTRHPRAEDDKGWWRELVGRVLDGCGIGTGRLDRASYFEELYAEFARPGVWSLFPEVIQVLDALAPHVEMGIISNFDGRLRAILEHLGIAHRFRYLLISSEVGADKPAPWIFEKALQQGGVAPEEALHVGDDPVRDWQGATAAGMRVFRLERPRNSLSDLAPHV